MLMGNWMFSTMGIYSSKQRRWIRSTSFICIYLLNSIIDTLIFSPTRLYIIIKCEKTNSQSKVNYLNHYCQNGMILLSRFHLAIFPPWDSLSKAPCIEYSTIQVNPCNSGKNLSKVCLVFTNPFLTTIWAKALLWRNCTVKLKKKKREKWILRKVVQHTCTLLESPLKIQIPKRFKKTNYNLKTQMVSLKPLHHACHIYSTLQYLSCLLADN